jgi:cytochrome c oxidase subunit 4
MSHPIVKPPTYLAIYAILIVLTGTTVFMSRQQLGFWEVPVALGIATVKTVLVGLFFMHMLHSNRLTWLVVGAGAFFLAILLSLTLADYWTRDWMPNQAPPGAYSEKQESVTP